MEKTPKINMFIKPTFCKILSLCVLGICAATLITFSQTNDTPPKVEVTTTAQTMPVTRTLTSADGRTIDVVIVSKSETAIKAKRADGKEFEITLDKLSEADKSFIGGLTTAPMKNPRVLIIGGIERLGGSFDITELNTTDELKAMTDQELESFDAIVVTRSGASNYWACHPEHIRIQKGTDNYIQRDRILKLTTDGKVVAWRNYHKIDKRKFIEDKVESAVLKGNGVYKDEDPFIDVQGNTIFYSWTSQTFSDGPKSKKKGSGGEIAHNEIFDQLGVELKKLIQNQTK